MTRSARADVVVFAAQLLASNEVPPVTNADANAFGQVTVTVDTTTNSFSFEWGVNNLGASALILSHIHEGAAGVNGPVRVDSGLSPANPVPVVNGSGSFSKSGIIPSSDAAGIVSRLLANPSSFYFNVHSNLNPGGVVRGQLVRQATPPSSGVPTLSEWGAILMGLLIVAACVFFLAGRSKSSMALAATASPSFEERIKVTDWRLLAKVTLYVESAIALVLVALSAGAVDIAGALASGLVAAFILHLLISGARQR
jgi:hypothetical protein